MPSDPLQNTVEVKYDGDVYNFKVPSQLDSAKIGSQARYLRAVESPDGNPSEEGLDDTTRLIYMAIATIQILVRPPTSAKWLYSKDENGKPAIIPGNFPDDAPILEVYGAFLDALDRFHSGGDSDRQPQGNEVVDDSENTEQESI